MGWPEPKLSAFFIWVFFPPDLGAKEMKYKSEEWGEKRESMFDITVGFDLLKGICERPPFSFAQRTKNPRNKLRKCS